MASAPCGALNRTQMHAGRDHGVVTAGPDFLADLDSAFEHENFHVRVAHAGLALIAAVEFDFQRTGAGIDIQRQHFVFAALEAADVEFLIRRIQLNVWFDMWSCHDNSPSKNLKRCRC